MSKTMTIHFKDGRTLPSVPYSEQNIRDYEKNLGETIKEFVIDKTEEKIAPTAKIEKKAVIALADITPDIKFALFKELEEKHQAEITGMAQSLIDLKKELQLAQESSQTLDLNPVLAPMADLELVKELTARGKSELSISKFLGIQIPEIKAMLAPRPQN